MAIGEVKYGEYGLTEIDSAISSTAVNSFEVDINDAAESNSVILVQGSFQSSDLDNQAIYIQFIDASDAIINCSYVTKNSSTNQVLRNNAGNSTFLRLNYWGLGNQNSTVYDPIAAGLASGSAAESAEFQLVINNERSTSAPIRRCYGFHQTIFYSTSATLHLSRGGFDVRTDTNVRKLRIKGGGTSNVTASIKVHSLFANV